MGHKIPERSHGLTAEVPSLADVVTHDGLHAPGFPFSVRAVQVIHQGAVNGHVGHLSADDAGLHLTATQVGLKFRFQEPFHFRNEIRPLVIKNIRIIKGFCVLVLGITKGRIHDGKPSHHGGEGHFRGDEVDAGRLSPGVVVNGFLKQLLDFMPGFPFLLTV